MSKAEELHEVLPDDVLARSAKIIVNEGGKKTVVNQAIVYNEISLFDDPANMPDTVTLIYNMPLDSAITFFKSMKYFQQLSAKAKL